MILWKCAPCLHRKHNSEYSHKAFSIKSITFGTSKRPKQSPCWWWFSALSLCCSFLSPFIPSMPPKLDLTNPCKYVYYCYRWLPWATSMVYPTSYWWHLDVPITILPIFWPMQPRFDNLLTYLMLFGWHLDENLSNICPKAIQNLFKILLNSVKLLSKFY